MATVAQHMIAALHASGVRRVYGIPGDSLNGFTDAIRRSGEISWEHVRHEEAAAFAATADAALTGELAVCAGSAGPGNLHLINGLFDAQRTRVPVLAIAAHIPLDEVGSQYFQETHPQELFRECSVYCELVSKPEMAPRILEMAIRTAIEQRGVAVVVLPGEVFPQPAEQPGLDDSAGAAHPLTAAARRRVVAPGRRHPQPLEHISRSWPARAAPEPTTTWLRWPRRCRHRSCTRCAARSTWSTTTPTTSA